MYLAAHIITTAHYLTHLALVLQAAKCVCNIKPASRSDELRKLKSRPREARRRKSVSESELCECYVKRWKRNAFDSAEGSEVL